MAKFRFCFLIWIILFLCFKSALAQSEMKNLREKPVVKEIVISGNTYFSNGKIADQMSTQKNRFYNFLKRKKLNPRRLPVDAWAIDSLYHINGFLEAKATIDYKIENGKAIVQVKIDEGKQTKLGKLKLEGGLESLNLAAEKVIRRAEEGKPYNPSQIRDLSSEIRALYANNGYPYVQIEETVEKNEEKSIANLSFRISPGEKVFFGKVTCQGLKFTQPNIALREIVFKKGEVYSREKIMDSEQRIYGTGLFNYLSLDVENLEEKPLNPDFNLRLVEKKPSFVRFNGGLAQSQQQDLSLDFLGEWGNRNLFGTGRSLSLSAYTSWVIITKLENLNNRFSINYTEPWLVGVKFPLLLDVYYEPGIRSVFQQDYHIQSWGGDITFLKEFKRYTKVWLGFGYQRVSIFGVPQEEQEKFLKEMGINVRRKIDLTIERDTRDNPLVPMRGAFTQIYAEQVGGFLGGQNNLVKFSISWNRYNQLSHKSGLDALATRLKFGYVEELTSKDYVPTFDRFYLGGASTIRGYAENSMGPKDENGDPLGAKVILIGNIELRRGLFWKFGYTFFVDAGNGWLSANNISLDSIRVSGGLGLEFFTPIGPLRLDYGYRLKRGGDEKEGRFHLSVLYAF
jgi:outer membrane protein insertion porin family